MQTLIDAHPMLALLGAYLGVGLLAAGVVHEWELREGHNDASCVPPVALVVGWPVFAVALIGLSVWTAAWWVGRGIGRLPWRAYDRLMARRRLPWARVVRR